MKTCETCRFFGTRMGVHISGKEIDSDDEAASETAHHACARVLHGNGYPQPPNVEKEPAIITDGSGYAARLRVLPSFGCVLHEAKA